MVRWHGIENPSVRERQAEAGVRAVSLDVRDQASILALPTDQIAVPDAATGPTLWSGPILLVRDGVA
jgi:hypothetical protein